MSRSLKRILFTVGGAAGLLVLVAFAVTLLVDLNRYKPRLEAAASGALGADVRVGGRLGMGFFPGFHITVEDGRILGDQGVTVVSARKATLWIRLLPLLRREFRLSRIALAQPELSIERDLEGGFDLESLKKVAALLGTMDGVSLSNGTLRLVDRRSGEEVVATGFDLAVSRTRASEARNPQALKGLFLKGALACAEIRTNEFSVSALKASINGKHGVIDLEPVSMRIFGGQAAGSLQLDVSGPVPLYQVRCPTPSFRIEEFLNVLSPNRAAEGAMASSASARVRQAIRGSFRNPTVEKPRVLKSLAGPALKLYRQARSIFPSGPCDVFYSGSVPPPR